MSIKIIYNEIKNDFIYFLTFQNMGKHYFVCTCGVKCDTCPKDIKKHLTSDNHHRLSLIKNQENEIEKLNRKMEKLFVRKKKMSDNDYIQKSLKYKKKYEFLKSDNNSKGSIIYWTYTIDLKKWKVYLFYNVDCCKEKTFELDICSRLDY